jgi:hypothetical protein
MKKKYEKAKEELWKLKFFTMQKYIIFKKKSSKRKTKNPSRYYYNSITNLNFQHKPENLFFKKSYKNRPIIIIIIT